MRKRGKFLTFWFSLLPGAGYMYMGFMKKGVSMMSLFFGTIAMLSILNMDTFILALPVIWFYAFFDQMNIVGLPEKVYFSIEDDYIITHDGWESFRHNVLHKYKKEIASVMILFGLYVLFNTLVDFLEDILPGFLRDMIYSVSYRVPQIIFACIIILIGVHLIGGKKRELEDDYYPSDSDYDTDESVSFQYEEQPVERAEQMASMYNSNTHQMDTSMYEEKSPQSHDFEPDVKEQSAQEKYSCMAADIQAMDEAKKQSEDEVKAELTLTEEQKAKIKAAIAGHGNE